MPFANLVRCATGVWFDVTSIERVETKSVSALFSCQFAHRHRPFGVPDVAPALVMFNVTPPPE
jgi:hypothetical protein